MRVVSNTSPLTSLAAIGRFDLLRQLFGELHIAEDVRAELNAGSRAHPGSREVEKGSWSHLHHHVDAGPLVRTLRRDLDRGEAETLALAVELEADLVLLDEREGRRAATRLGLDPLGGLGILLESKERGHLEEILPHLDALRQRAGFYLGQALYRQVLKFASET